MSLSGSSSAGGYRLRKSEDGSIFGPVDKSTLIEWAESAQIAPVDDIDECNDEWKKAPEIDFLGMIYEVNLDDGTRYGPTTVGTLREFVEEGIIKKDIKVQNVQRKIKSPLVALLERKSFEGTLEDAKAKLEGDDSALAVLELAKDQRIRQLEEDLRSAKKQYDDLLERYRQANKELNDLKSS